MYGSRGELSDKELARRALREGLGLLRPASAAYLKDPVRWAHDKVEVDLWSKQKEIIESVRDNRQTAVHSAHDVGKSLSAACTGLWWIESHPIGEAFVVTSAPTHPQVAAILWREFNRLHSRGNLTGRMNLLEWYVGNELIAFGRKPADYDPAAFQGIHSRYVLVIFDEACGIQKELWDAASTLVANEGSRFLAIGNPDDPHSEFARVCKPDSGWSVVHVSAFDSPNFTGEPVSDLVRDSLVSPTWVKEKEKSWGKDSALYIAKVEGRFPRDSDKGVIPYSWAQHCKTLQLPMEGGRFAGLDVGGSDDGDATVLRERVGQKVGREKTWQESDPMKLVGEIALLLNEWEIDRVVVDSIGIGWGIVGRLRELSSLHNPTEWDTTHRAHVVAFNAAKASTQPDQFINKRAEMHWNGRELCRTERWDLEFVDDDTIAELTEAHYEILDSRGKIKIEAKAEIKKRLGRSPDRADAILMAFWEGDSGEARFVAPSQILTTTNYKTNGRGMGISPDAKAEEAALLTDLLTNRPR